MKSFDHKVILITLVIAVASFFIVDLALSSTQLDAALMLAVGIIIGSVVSQFLKSDTQQEKQSNLSTTTLYVGNLPYRANEHVVRELFEEQGQVFSVRLLKDKNTGKRRGFGFVEMSKQDAEKAITQLNEREFQQRTLKVREAKQKPEGEMDHSPA
ncbi:RNA-binding protein [Pseudoalteromonas sp. GCY]|uniref:RNA recognition motif domain-containing protein n=1 Tax=Pseudoalteromonas TaxID=53246 RepID=UPI0005FA7545|nr:MULTISPECIES: RNA-binding protein [Pseudoalteromonas]KJZ04156.1 RNA-binding protein [Pseudoalteromonas piscicida]MCG7542286.1 RNA-binding protein [Pseudoalteromonas sp. OF7H-1]MCG9770803.1 RNA-binding protein [Pseudoalteromonas piscicida]ODB33490.1 RNA-binding protein [Pseudoalteromonas sp. BMB]PHI34835.1 RNA-binding protein [Pseudoalteromonas sp. GCY]